MSCHRFDRIRCRRPNRFPVTGSIVYTIIRLPVCSRFPDTFVYPFYSIYLTTPDAAFYIPVLNYSKNRLNSQTGRPVYTGQPAFPLLF